MGLELYNNVTERYDVQSLGFGMVWGFSATCGCLVGKGLGTQDVGIGSGHGVCKLKMGLSRGPRNSWRSNGDYRSLPETGSKAARSMTFRRDKALKARGRMFSENYPEFPMLSYEGVESDFY